MARLYEMPREDANPELTGSLARSFKDGLILPAERKFSLLENEIIALREHIDTDALKKEQWLNEYFNRMDTEITGLKKMFRLSSYLAILSLVGIIATLVVLFFWY